jgi:hypothetical protein
MLLFEVKNNMGGELSQPEEVKRRSFNGSLVSAPVKRFQLINGKRCGLVTILALLPIA